MLARVENKVMLHNISWETYERLLGEIVESPGTLIAYDDGSLEIMQVRLGHEVANRTLASIVATTAIETGRDFCRAGSTTFKRKDLLKGFEPDSSFYFRHADIIRAKDEVEMGIDPPPELTIEVDITNSSLNRFRIYASIGVEEVWRYDGERVRFHALEGHVYREIAESMVLPPMSAGQATILLEQSRREKATLWDRAVRAWVRANI